MAHACLICRTVTAEVFYQEGPGPVCMNRLFPSKAEARAAPLAALSLACCRRCGLIFQATHRPELMQFDASYDSEQALSPRYLQHITSVAASLCKGQQTATEIGCGKGAFLRLLEERGLLVVGFDPSYEGGSPTIHKEAFTNQPLHADLLVLRHLLDEVPDPVGLLQSAAKSNQRRGEIYIEVLCAEACSILDLCYERVSYFSAASLSSLFRECSIETQLDGSYLALRARLCELLPSAQPPLRPSVQPRYEESANRLRRFLQEGAPWVVWGASNKGGRLANLFDPEEKKIRYFVDLNPNKQNKHLPGTGHKILSPQEALSDRALSKVLVVNPAYLEEVKQMIRRPEVQCVSLWEASEKA